MSFLKWCVFEVPKRRCTWLMSLCATVGVVACVCQPVTAGDITLWEGDINDDWNTAGNWAIWVDKGGLVQDPAPTPPTFDQVARIGTNSPVLIGPGVDATADEFQIGRDVNRKPVGATLNITGGSLTIDYDQFTLWGGNGENAVFVNQTGGTVNLGSRPDEHTPALAIANINSGDCTYTLNGPDAMLIGALGNRIISVGRASYAAGTFDHVQGTVQIGTLQVAAYIDRDGNPGRSLTGTYNLEENGILQVDVAVNMSANNRDTNNATFNFHGGTLSRDFVGDPGGTTELNVLREAGGASEVVFTGYGTVDFGVGMLTNNGKVIADSLGESGRELDLSGFGSVINDEEDGPSADGWFAVNKGRLLLPDIFVAPGSGTYNWGESSDDAEIDRVNSLQMAFTNVSMSAFGDLAISLLAVDQDDIDDSEHTFVGVWHLETDVEFDSVDLSIRYDQTTAEEAGIMEGSLKLFASDDGSTWTDLAGIVDNEAKLLEKQVNAGFASYYAVGISGQALIPGDANGDGKVTDADAAILATNWQQSGMSWSEGDFNDDGMVTDADAAILATHWQEGVEGSAAAVPEPAAIVMLVSGALLLMVWRRRCVVGAFEK